MEKKDIIFLIVCIIATIVILISSYIYYNDYVKLKLPEQSSSNMTIIFDEKVYDELLNAYNKPYESLYILKGSINKNIIYVEDLERINGNNKSLYFVNPYLFSCKIDNGCLGTIHTHLINNPKRCSLSAQDLYAFGNYDTMYGFVIEGIECQPGYFYMIYTNERIINFKALKYKIVSCQFFWI